MFGQAKTGNFYLRTHEIYNGIIFRHQTNSGIKSNDNSELRKFKKILLKTIVHRSQKSQNFMNFNFSKIIFLIPGFGDKRGSVL